MLWKYHNHKQQTNPLHREEEPKNTTRHQEDKLSKAINSLFPIKMIANIVSEYDQEIPQSQTAD